MMVLDILAYNYVDEAMVDLIGPPERYVRITPKMIRKNAARVISEESGKNDESGDKNE